MPEEGVVEAAAVEEEDVLDDVVAFDVRDGVEVRDEDEDEEDDEVPASEVADAPAGAEVPTGPPEVGAAVLPAPAEPPGVAVLADQPPAVGRGAAVVRGAVTVGRAVVGEVDDEVGAAATGGATLGDWLEPSRKPTEVPGAGS